MVNPRMKNNPEKSAGFYLKQSATYQGIAIGAVVSGGTLIGVLASSDEKNVRTSGYIAGGIFCLGGIGCQIASIIFKYRAGIVLDKQLGNNTTLSIADNGLGAKLTF